MARSPSDSEPRPAKLSPEEIRSGIELLTKRKEELESFSVEKVVAGDDPSVIALEAAISRTLESVFGLNTPARRRYAPASQLHKGAAIFAAKLNGPGYSLAEASSLR
jgi:hypothetical protein